jgi:hypothetical protein
MGIVHRLLRPRSDILDEIVSVSAADTGKMKRLFCERRATVPQETGTRADGAGTVGGRVDGGG